MPVRVSSFNHFLALKEQIFFPFSFRIILTTIHEHHSSRQKTPCHCLKGEGVTILNPFSDNTTLLSQHHYLIARSLLSLALLSQIT